MGKIYEFPARHAEEKRGDDALPTKEETRLTFALIELHLQLIEHVKNTPCAATWGRRKVINKVFDECAAERELVLEITDAAAVNGCYDGNWTETMEREFQARMAEALCGL